MFATEFTTFAARVNAAARTVPGWMNSQKRFISDVRTALGEQPGEFDRQLIAAQMEGLIELSRADLVEAMPYAKVAASEIVRMAGSIRCEFHFVRV